MICCRSLYDKKIRIKDDIITVDENADEVSYGSKVLFTETFYDDDMKKYKIISISTPLIPGTETYQEEHQDILRTEEDCREFLTKMVVGGSQILRSTEQAADEFNFIHSPGMNYTLLRQQMLILFILCLQTLQI